jgi:hypothetical protein
MNGWRESILDGVARDPVFVRLLSLFFPTPTTRQAVSGTYS